MHVPERLETFDARHFVVRAIARELDEAMVLAILLLILAERLLAVW